VRIGFAVDIAQGFIYENESIRWAEALFKNNKNKINQKKSHEGNRARKVLIFMWFFYWG
jgi:hypothetical protein